MTLPPDPYSSIPTKDRVKLQSYVPADEKDLLMTVLPNRDLYTLLNNHALKRTADFIRRNALTYCPADQKRLLDFVIRGFDSAEVTGSANGLREHSTTRTPGDTVPRDATRSTTRVRRTVKGGEDKPANVR